MDKKVYTTKRDLAGKDKDTPHLQAKKALGHQLVERAPKESGKKEEKKDPTRFLTWSEGGRDWDF